MEIPPQTGVFAMIAKTFGPSRLKMLRDHEESAVAGAEQGGRDARSPVRRRGAPVRRRRTGRPAACGGTPGRIASGERPAEISEGSSFLSVYDSSFGGHQ